MAFRFLVTNGGFMRYTTEELRELGSERPSSHDLMNLHTRRKLAIELENTVDEKDRAYLERNWLVLLLASQFGGWLVDARDKEPGWSKVLIIELPEAGQISFHLPDAMIAETLSISTVVNDTAGRKVWDGHSTHTKWIRVDAYTRRNDIRGDVPPGKEADTTPDQ